MTEPAQEFIKLVTVGDSSFVIARDPDGATRIGVSGHLVYANRQEFKQLALDQLERGDRVFVLDLLRCGYIDSACLGVIVSISKKIHDAGGQLRIEGLNEDLVTLFRLTKLDTFLTIAPAAAIVPPLKKADESVQTSASSVELAAEDPTDLGPDRWWQG